MSSHSRLTSDPPLKCFSSWTSTAPFCRRPSVSRPEKSWQKFDHFISPGTAKTSWRASRPRLRPSARPPKTFLHRGFLFLSKILPSDSLKPRSEMYKCVLLQFLPSWLVSLEVRGGKKTLLECFQCSLLMYLENLWFFIYWRQWEVRSLRETNY